MNRKSGYRRPPEDPEFYGAVVALRRIGKRVRRVDRNGSTINGKYLPNTALLERAHALLHPPVQLELFEWGGMTDTAPKVDPGGYAPEDHLSGPGVDPERQMVRINGKWRRLPKKRWQIFELLLARRGRVVPYDFIVEAVWDRDPPDSDAAIRTQLWMLRADLTGGPWRILTHWMIGLELVEGGEGEQLIGGGGVEPVGASSRYSKYSRRPYR